MKHLFFIIAAITLGTISSLSLQGQTVTKPIGLYTMNIGAIEMVVISDGHLLVNPVQAEFAQGVDSSEVAETLKKHFSPSAEIDLAMNILLLKTKNRYILIDAGAGYVFGEGSGKLAENLRYAGISPGHITDIVLTHAHTDHIGGLTDREGKLVFPNAEVYLAREEYDFWMSPEPDFSKSTMTDKKHMSMLVDVAQRNIRTVDEKLHLFKDGDDLFGCMQVNIAPGYTPGHSIIRIYSQKEELYHIADIVHSEIISFLHPEWIYNSDTDYLLGIETRRKVLEQMTNSKALFFAYHLPWPGLGYVRSKADGYEWVQKRITMPY